MLQHINTRVKTLKGYIPENPLLALCSQNSASSGDKCHNKLLPTMLICCFYKASTSLQSHKAFIIYEMVLYFMLCQKIYIYRLPKKTLNSVKIIIFVILYCTQENDTSEFISGKVRYGAQTVCGVEKYTFCSFSKTAESRENIAVLN